MAKRVRKSFSGQARKLNGQIRQKKEPKDELLKDDFYARFLNGDPDRKLTYSEKLEIYEHSLAVLDSAARKAGLR